MSEPRDPKTEDAMAIMGEERRKSGFALDPRKHADYLRSKGETRLSSVLDSAPIVAIIAHRYAPHAHPPALAFSPTLAGAMRDIAIIAATIAEWSLSDRQSRREIRKVAAYGVNL